MLPLFVGEYYPLQGMEETVRQKLVDDHFLFVSGDKVRVKFEVKLFLTFLFYTVYLPGFKQ